MESNRDLKPGDYVEFSRIVRTERETKLRSATGESAGYLRERTVVDSVSGSGLVLKVAKARKRVDGVLYHTARIDAGPLLGVVTAILDDAVLIGVQQAMPLSIEESAGSAPNVYGTTGDVA